MGSGVEPGDQAAEGVPGQDVGAGDPGRGQEGVQVRDYVLGGGGLGDGVAAAAVVGGIGVECGARAVVGADAGKGGHPGQDGRRRHLVWQDGPGAAGVAAAGEEDDSGTALPAAPEEHSLPAADVDQPREVAWVASVDDWG